MRRTMLLLSTLLVTVGVSPLPCAAQAIPAPPAVASASSLHFENGIMATRPGDTRVYILLGSGFLRPTTAGDPEAFVSHWLAAHPKAIAVPISRMIMTNTITHVAEEIVYIWLDDGAESLNVDLVAAGIFRGATMCDMVDNAKGLEEMLKDPSLADTRAEIEKERAAAPQDRTDRLMSDSDYLTRMKRVADAEQAAHAKKLGIWSDAMKDEREADGVQ